MTSAPLLKFDELLRPIPGDVAAGKPMDFLVLQDLGEKRREAPGDGKSPEKKADWQKIEEITTSILTEKGKDLDAAVRLVEAVTKSQGVVGLRDGLRLLQRMFAECWDRLLPLPEDGDTDVREARIIWLNDVARGAGFPNAITTMPVFRIAGGGFGPLDLKNAARKAAFDEALVAAKPTEVEALRTTHADLLAAKEALKDLNVTLDSRRKDKDNAPDYVSPDSSTNIGGAIERCIEMVVEIAQKRNFPLVPITETAAGAVTAKTPEAAAQAQAVPTREGLYKQIEQIAVALRRIEPHSPIPFLLERCVKLGAMPFPDLMKAIIQEKNVLGQLDQLLGLEKVEKK